MKTYLADIIPKIRRFSEKLDNITLLTNQHWVVIDEINNAKNVYIFRNNQELLISQNGKVEKAKWEYLGNNALLIDRKDDSYLFKHGFFDENILALKIDGKEEYAFLVNETKFREELNSIKDVIEWLTWNYLNPQLEKSIHSAAGISEDNSSLIKILNYKHPKYTITKKSDHFPLFRDVYSCCLITFDDNIKGKIFVVQKDNQAYFKHYGNIHYYENPDSCIAAFHHFTKTKKLLKDGYIKTIF